MPRMCVRVMTLMILIVAAALCCVFDDFLPLAQNKMAKQRSVQSKPTPVRYPVS